MAAGAAFAHPRATCHERPRRSGLSDLFQVQASTICNANVPYTHATSLHGPNRLRYDEGARCTATQTEAVTIHCKEWTPLLALASLRDPPSGPRLWLPYIHAHTCLCAHVAQLGLSYIYMHTYAYAYSCVCVCTLDQGSAAMAPSKRLTTCLLTTD